MFKSYTITRLGTEAQTAPIRVDQFTGDGGIYGEAQVQWDEDGLYVTLRAYEKEPLARYTSLNDPVCKDSCIEFFFSPQEGDVSYFNFETNPLGTLYCGFGQDRYTGKPQFTENWKEYFDIRNERTEDGFVIRYHIPLAFIRKYLPDCTLYSGKKMRGNFYKCGEDTPVEHYLSWSRVDTPRPDFHRPEFFGYFTLE